MPPTALFSWRRPVFRTAAEVFLGGLKPYVGNWYEPILTVGAFLVLWLILLHMYRRRLFVRI
jgi:predicted acyltransferase